MEGDIVAWTPADIEDVEIGDVVVFKSYVHWPDEKIVVHRVSNIEKDSKGNILLETKGDNNKWTDQAGPHIPEPYIREDHLMGKVLSIGKQPLKIPFIGYIGVWINQGLNWISQPTSSKAPLSYAGIFAPLTISVVILTLLIFIIPEKARTIKEKIRLNIFGRKPLNLKKTLLSFLIIYVVLLLVIHCFAHDSQDASIGIDADSPSSSINFGNIKPGKESLPKDLAVINPGSMPIKGIIFGQGEISHYINRQTFELDIGETKTTKLKAVAKNGSLVGSYQGNIMVYSSPFWLIFPNEFIQFILNWNAEATVLILDLLSGLILTTITIFILILLTYIADKFSMWLVDRSWQYSPKHLFNKKLVKKGFLVKKRVKSKIAKGTLWITKIDFPELKFKETIYSSFGKPIFASLIVLPILYFIVDQILAIVIAVLIAVLFVYFINCKIRNKIVLTVIITMVLTIVHMIIQSTLIILSQNYTMIEIMAFTLGAIGIYLLLFSLILIPLALISWLIVHLIRNIKERKDPLLSLEGSCDL